VELSFALPGSSSHAAETQETVGSRRDFLSGLMFGLLPVASTMTDSEPAWAQAGVASNAYDSCRCCTRDWCITSCTERETGETTQCDCADYIGELAAQERTMRQGGGRYRPPMDAEKARADSIANGTGEAGWAAKVRWETALIPMWLTEDGSRLTTKDSKVGEGTGLFTTGYLQKNTVLPPYSGNPLSVADIKRMKGTPAMENVWCPLKQAKLLNLTDAQLQMVADQKPATTFCIDGSTSANNPARYVKGIRTKEQCKKVNVEICEYGQIAYFRLKKDVRPNVELLADFGDYDFDGC